MEYKETIKLYDKDYIQKNYYCNEKLIRYNDYINTYSINTMNKLFQSSIFIVGVGALGSEALKQCSLLGMSINNGNIFITDNDIIEKSNLNR